MRYREPVDAKDMVKIRQNVAKWRPILRTAGVGCKDYHKIIGVSVGMLSRYERAEPPSIKKFNEIEEKIQNFIKENNLQDKIKEYFDFEPKPDWENEKDVYGWKQRLRKMRVKTKEFAKKCGLYDFQISAYAAGFSMSRKRFILVEKTLRELEKMRQA